MPRTERERSGGNPAAAVGERSEKPDKHLLIHCRHGGRSLRVTQFLRANGYDAVSNVAGGIDAWSLTIDSTVPRY